MLLSAVSDIVVNALAKGLGDQLFSIVLLFGGMWYLIRRLKATEDRLDKYVTEDRQRVFEALENSTKALENNTRVLETLRKP